MVVVVAFVCEWCRGTGGGVVFVVEGAGSREREMAEGGP